MKIFKSENIWLGYFAIWSYLQKNKLNDIEEYKLIDNFVENVITTKDEDIKDLKLNNKAFNIGNTYNFFRGLI
jgi:UTP-glucose-1-phosphate uridylyltransferase